MRSVNLAVQLSAVTGCVLLRLLSPSWLLIIFFVLVPICSIALIMQIVLACVAMPRRRLTTSVSIAFGLLAGSLLGLAVLTRDGGDSERWTSQTQRFLLDQIHPTALPVRAATKA